ncbi:MAG: efflux RND transporter periplasmic adaptor subunit [Tepidisphaeraceae bacterium]
MSTHDPAPPAQPDVAAQPAPVPPANPTAPTPVPARPRRRVWTWVILGLAVVVVLVVALPWVIASLNTVSTDDAYVSGHVTFVAPRVAGQVLQVYVEDNNRVRKGDLLLRLDPEPWQKQVDIAQAAVDAADADVLAARANARALEGQTRSARFNLERAIEDVNNQVAVLRSKVAALQSAKATLTKAEADFQRVKPLVGTGAVTQDEVDKRKESLEVAQAKVEESLQEVYQIRVSLGLPPRPESGDDLTQVPANLDQTFSAVRQAQASVIQGAAQLGVLQPFSQSPKDMVAEFYRRDPSGNIDKIYDQLLNTAPGVKQAQAKLLQARANLDQAKLNLRYCDVYAEIDGVVTRREVNPGNNVIAGQSVMALRSLTDIWVDANFKETQLKDLRIGQPVDLDVDMYGSSRRFNGRISGFTMGTGSTLALLPAENATGNFVKVVQRLPVRIDLIDYDPEKAPLFVGTSVTPTVHIHEAPSGPKAGSVLQPYLTAATQPSLLPGFTPGAATQPSDIIQPRTGR